MIKRFYSLAPILVCGLLIVIPGCGLLDFWNSIIPGTEATLPATVPDFQAAVFSKPTQIDNQYLPLTPGLTYTYRSQTADGLEEIVVEVTNDTREVVGIACRVVRDRVYLDGVLIEDTHDWYAQDDAGNVWYLGEEVDNYNYDDNGDLIDVTHEGAWESGLDVAGLGVTAVPGYMMPASVAVGDTYHQEYYAGEAEDMAKVLALGIEVTLTDGTVYTCLRTRDYSSLDPTIDGFKYYAPGIGVVMEESVDGSEIVELISVE